MVSVTSVSRYITSTSRYHPRYQSRSSMFIRGLIPRNFAEFAEAVPIGLDWVDALSTKNHVLGYYFIKKYKNETLYWAFYHLTMLCVVMDFAVREIIS